MHRRACMRTRKHTRMHACTHTYVLTGNEIPDKSFPILFFTKAHKFSFTLGFVLMLSLRHLMVDLHDVTLYGPG